MDLRATSVATAAMWLLLGAHGALARSAPVALSPDAVNDAALAREVRGGSSGAATLRAQVLLERARFSPGEIDAAYGSNMQRAIAGFQARNGIEASGVVDADTWSALNTDTGPVLGEHTIAAEDVAGPFVELPTDMMEKAELQALGFESAAEALGEKFHASPKLLGKLNPGKTFAAGETIVVPLVTVEQPLAKAATVVVDKSDSTVSLVDEAGATFAQFPASTGSERDPLPLGEWKVLGVARNPVFHYNPELFWDANPKDAKAKIPPGPNNPVGTVWVDLSKEHYGIHGTPEPGKVGKTQSHGCIRLANWNADLLAQAVGPGTPALLQD